MTPARRRSAPLAFALVTLLLGTAASGQQPPDPRAEARPCEQTAAGCAPEKTGDEEAVFRPTTSGPFVTFTAPIPAPGQVTAQPIFYAGFVRGAFDEAGAAQPLEPGERLGSAGLTFFLEAGVLSRLSVGAQAAVYHQWHTLPPASASATGPGDVQLFSRAVLVKERPTLLPEATLLAMVKLNTGNPITRNEELLDTDVLGSGSVDLTLGLDLTKGLRPVVLHADLLYTHPLPAVVGGVDTRYGDTFNWSASVEWPLVEEVFALMVEMNGRHQGPPTVGGTLEEDARLDEVVLGGGVEVLFSPRVQLLVGYQRTLWGRNVPAADAVIVTVVPTLF